MIKTVVITYHEKPTKDSKLEVMGRRLLRLKNHQEIRPSRSELSPEVSDSETMIKKHFRNTVVKCINGSECIVDP